MELTTMSTDINLPFITATQEGQHLNLALSCAVQQLAEDLINRTIPPMEKALKDAGLTPISTRSSSWVVRPDPKIQEIVKEFFGKDPHRGVNLTRHARRRRLDPGRCARR